MDPDGALMNFKKAPTNAFLSIFASCSLWREFSDFQKANIRKLRKMQLADYIKNILLDSEALYNAPTKLEFDRLIIKFKEKYNDSIPQYMNYFEKTWLQRFPSHTWAKFAKPRDLPSSIHIYFFHFFERIRRVRELS